MVELGKPHTSLLSPEGIILSPEQKLGHEGSISAFNINPEQQIADQAFDEKKQADTVMGINSCAESVVSQIGAPIGTYGDNVQESR